MRIRMVAAIAASTVALGTCLAAPPATATATVAATAAAAEHECARATQRCEGQIEVPLDWANPGSEPISVSFAWFPRRDRSRPASGTVLTIHGGPAAALPTADVYRDTLGPVLDSQNMLIIDPRGLGRSTPLLCPAVDLDNPQSVAACARALGPRVQYFTTDQAVADFDAVRRALGVESVSVYGSSYGTVWGHAYATRFPRETRAVLMDSVVRIGPNGYVRPALGRPVRPDLENLDVVCERSHSCQSLPSEPERTWAELVRRLRAQPDAAVPMASLLQLPQAVVEPPVGREINAAASAYLAGDPLPLRRLVGTFAGPPPTAGIAGPDPTAAGYLAYVCADAAFPYDREASPQQRQQQLDTVYQRHRPFRPFTTEEVLGATGGDEHQWCVNWPTPRQSPPVPPRVRYPAIPMLAIGGELDRSTTADDAVDLARRFPRGHSVVLGFGGHTAAIGASAGFAGSPYWTCAREVVRSFLADPDQGWRKGRWHRGCTAENYRAVGSFPLTADDVPRAIIFGMAADERTLISAAFATAVDSLARRNPNGAATSQLTQAPGLRGGVSRFPDRATVTLDRVRLVSDVEVSGWVTLDDKDRARAVLTVSAADGRLRKLKMPGRPSRPEGLPSP